MWDVEDEERPEDDEPESEESKVVHFILKAIFLWKAMYVMSDAAISFILNSVVTIMDMLVKFSHSDRLRNLVEVFPKTLYMARKRLNSKRDDFEKYVVCGKCYNLHDFDSSTIQVNGKS